MLSRVPVSLALAGAVLLGCAVFGGSSRPDHCKIRVVNVEEWNVQTGKADVSYRVSGEAGSPALVWLAAEVGERRYLSGGGVDVGPGPFQAIISLRLTGLPRQYVAMLEVAGHRCTANAKMPRS